MRLKTSRIADRGKIFLALPLIFRNVKPEPVPKEGAEGLCFRSLNSESSFRKMSLEENALVLLANFKEGNERVEARENIRRSSPWHPDGKDG